MLNFKSKLSTKILSKVISLVLRKKFGHDVDVQIHGLTAEELGDGKIRVHLGIDVDTIVDGNTICDIIDKM